MYYFEIFKAKKRFKGKPWRYRNLEGDPKGVTGAWFITSEAADRFLRELFPKAKIFVRKGQ
jgi:hypothetical protein